MTLPDQKEWRVEALRVTLFGTEPFAPAGENWWKTVTGTDPEAAVNKPQSGEYSESGTFLNGQLELKAAFNRADWVLSFPFIGMPGTPEPKEMSVLLDEFIAAISGWANTRQLPVTRIAVGSVALQVVQNIATGNMLISKYVPFCDVSANPKVTDLFLQLNVPYASGVTGGPVNTVTKWAVQERQVFTIGNMGMPQISSNTMILSEFDLSTPAQGLSLSLNMFEALATEMKGVIEKTLTDGLRL
jgi:hypothetical protein